MLMGGQMIVECKFEALGSRFTEALDDLQMLVQPHNELSGHMLSRDTDWDWRWEQEDQEFRASRQ